MITVSSSICVVDGPDRYRQIQGDTLTVIQTLIIQKKLDESFGWPIVIFIYC